MPSLSSLASYLPTAGTQIVGGIINRRAAGKATKALTTGVNNATNTIQQNGTNMSKLNTDVWGAQKLAIDPYSRAGQTGLDSLQQGVAPGGSMVKGFSYTPADMENDPRYQFRLKQGERAIQAAANADGNRYSGATLKSLNRYGTDVAQQYYDQDYTRAENTFRANQEAEYNRTHDLAQMGQTAAGQLVTAAGQFGEQEGRSQQLTAAQIADLQTQLANAQAAGDTAKANSITDTLSGVAKTVGDGQTLAALKKGVGLVSSAASTAPIVGGTTAASLAIPAAPVGLIGAPGAAVAGGVASGGAAAGGAIPAAAASAAAPAGLTGYAGGGLVTSHGALVGMMTNPITIAAAAGIVGMTALIKSMAHFEANDFVKNAQNPFGQRLGEIVNGFDSAFASGRLDKATALEMRNATANAIQQFQAKLQAFAAKGGDSKKVAAQAAKTMATNFGPNWEKILGKMDTEIAGLA